MALPSIQRDLGFSRSDIQWVVTAYAITFGGLLIAGGRVADLFGRRRTFVIGLVGFALASLTAGLAQDAVLRLVSRAVQGVAAAVVAPSAPWLITTGFPAGRERTRALGLYGATASVGFVAGQVLGGILVQFTSWRAVFLVNVPIGLVVAVLAPRWINRDKVTNRHLRLDLGGAALGDLRGQPRRCSLSLRVCHSGGARSQLVRRPLWPSSVLAVSWWSSVTKPNPSLRLELLRVPSLTLPVGALTFLVGLWVAGEMLVLSYYLQGSLHESALFTGLAIAPQGIVGFTAGFFGARLSARLGIRKLLVLTGAAATSGFLILAHLPASGSYSPALIAVVLVGFGTAGTAFGATVMGTAAMADGDQGLVGGVINTTRQMGVAIGAAVLLAIADGGRGADGVATVGAIATPLSREPSLPSWPPSWLGAAGGPRLSRKQPHADRSLEEQSCNRSCLGRVDLRVRRTSFAPWSARIYGHGAERDDVLPRPGLWVRCPWAVVRDSLTPPQGSRSQH